MEDIHVILKEMTEAGIDGVLATIIEVEGSAYKKEGASMVFKKDGTQVGMLSAGCLEEDLAARIEHNHLGGKTETLIYDMRSYNELSWGEGSGCNGVIHVLVEPVTVELIQTLQRVKICLDERESVTRVKFLNSSSNERDCFITEGREVFGGVVEDLPLLLPLVKKVNPGKQSLTHSDDVFVQRYEPKPRLFVFGAGKDAMPLVSFAGKSGFSVTVSDWRPALCNKANFPDADCILRGFPNELMPDLNVTPDDYVVVLTHNFQKDREIISYLIDKELRYLGILGSEKRTKRLLGTREVPSRITSPIGLSIHAKGPEEIAISVVAELIHLKNSSKLKRRPARETS
ncbi:XdhC family protein [Halobacillus sp. A1]|uniref:XdhC family protein n=1 Tax=Halobacillus sp. A1 TaxID=2880262 RepID=UPI0020A6AFA9|nr:XdhC family protein [Halobacillus sp. A1]MCP3029906.1 XdhC family protein [Halobacillus sp. A1]